MNKLLLVSAFCMIFVAGCASEAEKIAADQLSVEQMRLDAEAARRAALTEKMEDQLDGVVPEWFLSPPKTDDTGIYGVGTGHSKDLGFAIRKAQLQAVYEAGKVLKQELSGQERSMQRDNGSEGDAVDRTELLIDVLVNRVPVSGYEFVKKEVVPFDGQFHSFVLAKVPFDEFNRVLKANKDSLKQEFDTAFDKLESRLNTRHQQELNDVATLAEAAAAAKPQEQQPSTTGKTPSDMEAQAQAILKSMAN